MIYRERPYDIMAQLDSHKLSLLEKIQDIIDPHTSQVSIVAGVQDIVDQLEAAKEQVSALLREIESDE